MSGTGLDLPTYKCHKEVKALKIEKITTTEDSGVEGGAWMVEGTIDGEWIGMIVPWEYIKKHEPKVGGYYVVYKDGYESFSPAKAFEEGYAKI